LLKDTDTVSSTNLDIYPNHLKMQIQSFARRPGDKR